MTVIDIVFLDVYGKKLRHLLYPKHFPVTQKKTKIRYLRLIGAYGTTGGNFHLRKPGKGQPGHQNWKTKSWFPLSEILLPGHWGTQLQCKSHLRLSGTFSVNSSCNLPTNLERNTYSLKLKFESLELSAAPATMHRQYLTVAPHTLHRFTGDIMNIHD
jgi:hypothetical protein